jgi:membrane fusion protein, multidrug efflux system
VTTTLHHQIIFSALVLFLLGCEQEAKVYDANPTIHDVSLGKISRENVARDFRLPGSVIVDERIQISSRITAYVKEIRVKEGQTVNIGDTLAVLDGADIEGAIREARAASGKATAAMAKAKMDLQRYQNLFEKDSATDNELRVAQLQYEVAKGNIAAANASNQTAKSQRRYVTIKSPVSGVVIERAIQPGDLATPGAPMVTIESRQQLLFETYISEYQVQQITPGMDATVTIDAIENKEFPAKVLRIVPSGDPVTRRYLVKLSLDQGTGLLPGMFGRVSLAFSEESIFALPKNAIVERGGLRGTFVVTPDNIARFRWFRFGREWPDRVEVTTGVNVDTAFVLNAPNALKDGDIVRSVGRQ